MHKLERNNISTIRLEEAPVKSFRNYAVHTNLKDPKISVIIPVYKEEKILEKTLKLYSPELRRKYNFELIISDGGSKDKTVEIAKKYADKIVVHNEKRRQTIAEGRNMGAEVAKGETLVFINADTFPVDIEDFFSHILNWTNNKRKFGALACYVSAFPEEEQLKDKIFYNLHNSYVNFLNKLGLGMGRGECQVVRKDVFSTSGKYNSLLVAGEDFDLYRRIAKVSKIKFDKRIHVYESPRRFRSYGYIKTLFYWLVNSITVMMFNRSASKEWEAIR